MTHSADSKLCGAKARGTGAPCKRPVRPWATRCRFHGGAATQVRHAADLRRTVAEIAAQPLSAEDRARRPGQMMLETAQHLDRILRSGSVDGSDYIRQAHELVRTCKVLIDSAVEVRLASEVTRDRDAEAKIITMALAASVEHTLDQLGLDHLDRKRVRDCLLRSAVASLSGGSLPALAPREISPSPAPFFSTGRPALPAGTDAEPGRVLSAEEAEREWADVSLGRWPTGSTSST